MIFGNDLSNSVDLSRIEFNGAQLRWPYTETGLFNSITSLSQRSAEQAPSAPPALEPSPAISAEELLFSGELDTIEVTSATDTTYDFDKNVDLTNWSDKSSDFVLELKHDVVELISEPQRLLDSGELYSDPLDVFDDIDFTW